MAYDLPVYYSEVPYNDRWKVRKQYIEERGGKCYHCKASLEGPPSQEVLDAEINWYLFPPGFMNHPHHLHHCHDTDLTIGTVHAKCNAVLWQYHGE